MSSVLWMFYSSCALQQMIWVQTPNKQCQALSNTPPIWFVVKLITILLLLKWLDFVNPGCIKGRGQYGGINVCVLDSVLRRIGNPCCSRQWLWSATVASIPSAGPRRHVIHPILRSQPQRSLQTQTELCVFTMLYMPGFSAGFKTTCKNTDKVGIDILITIVYSTYSTYQISPSQDYCLYIWWYLDRVSQK